MKAVMLKTPNGKATLHANGVADGAAYSYNRPLRDDEVIDGKPVKDWPVGVHTVHSFPKDG